MINWRGMVKNLQKVKFNQLVIYLKTQIFILIQVKSLHKKKHIKNEDHQGNQSQAHASNVSRNILEIRKRNTMATNNKSLQQIPRLKQSRSVKKGTISILQNNEEARQYLSNKHQDFVYSGRGEHSEKGKDRLRIQVVKWFQENKRELIQALNESKDRILGWVEYVQHINRAEFDIIMNAIEVKKDRNLMNRLFWLFDLNGDGTIDYNELQYSINLFREYSLDDKINIFFELCDENNDGYFDEEDLKRFLYKNLSNEEEARTMKFVLHDFYEELSPINPKGVTKEELKQAVLMDQNIKIIVEKNARILKQLSKKEEESNAFTMNNVLFQGQYEGKSGIFFPHIETLMKVVAEREQLIDYHQSLKADNHKKKKFAKTKEISEESEDDSDI